LWEAPPTPPLSIQESVHPKIRIDYPCLKKSRTGNWWNPWDYYWGSCHTTLDLGVYSFGLTCEAGALLSCCGAEVWGQCEATACRGSFCLTCTGVVDGGLGASTESASGACDYGINLSVSASCEIDSLSIPLAHAAVSPWSVTGPCVPDGCCGR
jgi:hypothetical protein